MEAWLDRLVPEDDPHFTHTLEGADDMPSHIKMALMEDAGLRKDWPHEARPCRP